MRTEPDDFDIAELRCAIERHWTHHALCHVISIEAKFRPHLNDWHISVAPANQELVGGPTDGLIVWSGFQFDVYGFLMESDMEFDAIKMTSRCVECNEAPLVSISGRFMEKPIFICICFEPIPGSEPLERLKVDQPTKDEEK